MLLGDQLVRRRHALDRAGFRSGVSRRLHDPQRARRRARRRLLRRAARVRGAIPIRGFAVIGLGTFDLGFAASREPTSASVWLYTDDVDAEIERLRASGVGVTREPADQEWGERLAGIRDPAGHEVLIGQQLRAPPTA